MKNQEKVRLHQDNEINAIDKKRENMGNYDLTRGRKRVILRIHYLRFV